MTNTQRITTHDIQLGDTILSDGMVLVIDQPINISSRRAESDAQGATLWTRARIANWDALVERAKTDTWIAGFIVGIVRSDMSETGHRARNGLDIDTEPRWTIQGNKLAQWARVIVHSESCPMFE